jgi:hypothetical protein
MFQPTHHNSLSPIYSKRTEQSTLRFLRYLLFKKSKLQNFKQEQTEITEDVPTHPPQFTLANLKQKNRAKHPPFPPVQKIQITEIQTGANGDNRGCSNPPATIHSRQFKAKEPSKAPSVSSVTSCSKNPNYRILNRSKQR